MGIYYAEGLLGLHQNYAKALELWHRAGELGDANSYYSLGNAYHFGRGVEKDDKKAIQYTKVAAMGGNANARHNLGATEAKAGNVERAMKHYMIAIKDGDTDSLERIKEMHMKGYATKGDYDNALKSYQEFLDEIRSDQRDEAAAFRDGYKYY